MKRKVFYSFHYEKDSWRAAMVRNIGAIDGNAPATDNDWESVKKGGDWAIKRWIAKQMEGRTCCVVLVGTHTANRKWINHEIIKSWNKGMGLVGIHIHGLKDCDGCASSRGSNPFDFITYRDQCRTLSSTAKCYDPPGRNSRERYDWIAMHISNAVEEAIRIRNAW